MNVHYLLQKAFMDAGLPGPVRLDTAGSGDTATSGAVTIQGRRYFVKMHGCADTLRAECEGLEALSGYVRVPLITHLAEVGGAGVLILEQLALRPPQDDGDWHAIGEALGGLHRRSRSRSGYGQFRDNYIGASRQANGTLPSWQRFFVERRLGPQLERAAGLPLTVTRQVEAIMAGIDAWLPDQPESVLLHGDLWTGNFALAGSRQGAEPVFYDPACYYGDPQVDLAMMALFGSVPASFYLAYQGALPDAHQRQCWRVYDLYHLLNHFNLFGAGYTASVARTAAQLLGQ